MAPSRFLGPLAALLSALAVAAPAAAFDLNGNDPWPGDPAAIDYSATVKGSGDAWAIKTAATAWSTAGPGVSLQRVPGNHAELRIRYGNLPCGRGYTSVSSPPHRGELTIGRCGRGSRYQQVQLVAHELGHALGLDHENDRCAVMNNHTVFRGSSTATHPYRCSPPPKDSWRCRLLQKDDVRGLEKLYGGPTSKLGPPNCKLVTDD